MPGPGAVDGEAVAARPIQNRSSPRFRPSGTPPLARITLRDAEWAGHTQRVKG